MQVHAPSGECGPSPAPSSPLTMTKPDGLGRILHQWIVYFQRNPWLRKCNWNFPDAAFKIKILDFHVKWIGLDNLGLYHYSNRLQHKILVVATAPLFLLLRWRLCRTLNFNFCSCSLSSLTKLHVVVQLSVPLSWNWRAPGLSNSKVRQSQTAIHRACHIVCSHHRDLIQPLSVMFSITIKIKIHILRQKKISLWNHR